MITNSFISKDGTTIAYYELGKGPSVILVHGGMEVAKSHIELANSLSKHYKVYIYDRRGRGKSDQIDVNKYRMEKEVEDLSALIQMTGAKKLFGISSGALISLQALLTNTQIEKAVIYEPPLSINGSAPTKWVSQFEKEIANGKINDALVTGMVGAQMGPTIFNKIPRWILKLLLLTINDKVDQKTEVSMSSLAPTLCLDGKLVIEMEGSLEMFRMLTTEVLLLGGTESPQYLKYALEQLEGIIPNNHRINLDGIGHGGSGNKNQGGQPEIVSEIMIKFYN